MEKKERVASMIIDNQVIETIYNQLEEKTKFAVYREGEVEFLESIKTSKGELYPLDGKNMLIAKKIILLPSEPIEYGSTQDLILEIKTFIHRYLDISTDFEEIASYYVLFTWLYDKFNEVPYLRAIGDFGSGKSRFLQTIGSVCYKPIFTGGASTSSPIFRILNDIGGTLVLDEADYKSSETTDDIIKILNMGFQRGGSVLRSEGKGVFEVKAYDVYSPKIVGTRETFSDRALESRFLVEEMGLGTLRKDIPRRLPDEFYDQAKVIRNKLLMWRFRNYFIPTTYDENLIEDVTPRLQQIAIPLLSIIETVEMKERLKTFVKNYNQELIADRGLSRESEIVFAILKLEYDTNHQKEFTMKDIAAYVNQDCQMDFADQLTPKKIGWYLRKKLQFKSRRTRNGFVLEVARNKKKLNFWKERFGITDADIRGELMNEVNIEEDIPFEGN